MNHHLLGSLIELLPNAHICLVAARPWYSLGLAGVQVSFSATVSGNDHAAVAAEFAGKLNEQDFNIPHRLVADIAVTDQFADKKQTRLVIDALLLED